jgi:type I restriction enzyme, S subunit
MGDWRTMTLGQLCTEAGGGIQTGPFGSQLHADDYVLDGIPSVMPQNIGDNRIDTEGIAQVSEVDMNRLQRHWLEPGDIVYSRRGDVERRALVRAENAGWLCGTGCLRVRIPDQNAFDSRFVSYALGLAEVRAWIVRHAVGATMLNLNTSILRDVPLRVPTVGEQRAIAEVLEALDDKIAANDRVVRLASEVAAVQFARAAEGAEFGSETFGDLADVGGGATPKTSVEEYWGGDVQWATPTDVTGLSAPYLTATSRMITESGLASCSSPLYPAGSILMTSRATIGAFAIAQRPTAVNQGFIVVNAKDPDLQWWLFHEMRARVDEFLAHANGATFLELPRRRFKQLMVRRPTKAVARKFADAVRPLHELSAQVLLENAALARSRDELLPLLMSGRLGVKDAEKVVEETL